VYRFPKSVRLLRADEYTAVLRAPDINLSSGPLRIRARRNRMPSARLGLVVTKKGNPKAVRRNRIKRIIREQFRRHAHALPAVDIVVQVFGHLEDEQLVHQLDRQFQRICIQL
jgi:ribonuclease P protein component